MTSPFIWYKNPTIEFRSGDSPLEKWYDSDKFNLYDSKSASLSTSNKVSDSGCLKDHQNQNDCVTSRRTNETRHCGISLPSPRTHSLPECPSQQQDINGITCKMNRLLNKGDTMESHKQGNPDDNTQFSSGFIPLFPLPLMNTYHRLTSPNNNDDSDTKMWQHNHEDIGFGFSFKKSTTEITNISDETNILPPPSPRIKKDNIERNSRGKNVLDSLLNVSNGSFQGNQTSERPRTPFSINNCVVAGRIHSDVESPLSSDYPPASPYVLQNTEMNNGRSKHSSSSAELILKTCFQKEPMPLKLVFENLRDLKKVGEGVYGEAYIAKFGINKNPRVYKIVAVEGDRPVNGEKQKKFTEILPEITVSQELSKLDDGVRGSFTDGFAKLYATRVCKGKYPECLINAWKLWHKENNSDNDCPDFGPGQLYVIFEFKYGGVDIEAYEFTTAKQTLSAVMQVAHIFAVGECSLGFEHRDAHWGNILVQDTLEEYVAFLLNGKSVKVPTFGVKVTVIDFTMSRITDDHGRPIYTDLSLDEEQFLGSGDFQFDIYRMMRDYNGNDWSQFFPKTNILWIYYLAEKMYFKGRYSNSHCHEHKVNLRSLQRLKDLIMDYDSCYDFVTRYLTQLTDVANS